jgi:hypothetical protein
MRRGDRCLAYARSTGKPCRRAALANGRCRNHGGLSTGPKSAEGKAKISALSLARFHEGHAKALKRGYKAWLNAGGRDVLKALARRRWRLKKWRQAAFS